MLSLVTIYWFYSKLRTIKNKISSTSSYVYKNSNLSVAGKDTAATAVAAAAALLR